ncbi:ubiquitin-conjugating enzyme family protein [Abortiporus biennis]
MSQPQCPPRRTPDISSGVRISRGIRSHHPPLLYLPLTCMPPSNESLIQKWLRQNTQAYQNKQVVFAHVDDALAHWSSIRPKTDIYTYDDGRTQLLLCLHGLLPITFRGASYNIPIALWISRDYPRQPPIAYVVPTSDMLVRASNHVDVSGKCQIQYLNDWSKKSEGCNVSALLSAMQHHFSNEPPVYAKPKQDTPMQSQTQRQTGHTTNYAERPPPPLPASQTQHTPPPPPSRPASVPSPRNDDRPPLPAKPGAAASIVPISASYSTPSPPPAIIKSPTLIGSANRGISPPPPLPPHPSTGHGLPIYNEPSPVYNNPSRYSLPSIEHSTPTTSTWTPVAASEEGRDRYSSPNQALPPPLSPSSTLHPYTQHAPISHVQHASQTPTPPPPPPPPPSQMISPTQLQRAASFSPPYMSPQVTGTHTLYQQPPPPLPPVNPIVPLRTTSLPSQPHIPIPDLLDDDDNLSTLSTGHSPQSFPPQAVIDAPPRPPNPELLRLHSQVHEKIGSELASLTQAMAIDAERLRANQTDLLTGEPAIRDEMARLEAVKDVCNTVVDRYRTVVGEAEKNIAELKRKGDPEVDELVCSTTIVHNQLINLIAEDNAIEDTIYHLHRALNTGRIDLERFLRTIRMLAEEQFMKRALIEKILNGIPMMSGH